MNRRREQNRGFILMDVLLGVVILTVAVVAIAGLYYQSTQANIFADNRTVAYNWAQSRIENLKATQGWRGVAGGASPAVSDTEFNATPPKPGFRIQTNALLATLPPGTLPATTQAVNVPMNRSGNRLGVNDYLLDVRVQVSWTENGRNETVELRTLIERD